MSGPSNTEGKREEEGEGESEMAMGSLCTARPCCSSPFSLPQSSSVLGTASPGALAIPLTHLRSLRLISIAPNTFFRFNLFSFATSQQTRSALMFDEGPQETEEEITKAYEELYGPKFGRLSKDRRWDTSRGGDDENAAGKPGKGRKGKGGLDEASGRSFRRGMKDNLEEKVVQVRRVTKVVTGGKQLSFRAIVVVGDKKGRVGVGVGKAKEVSAAVQKSGVDARRHMVNVPMTKYRTFPHRADGNYGAAKVMLRPAAPGTGVIAGGSVRVVLEMAGVENALGKQLRSNNPLNNARAVVDAVSRMKQFKDVAELRGIPMEELWK